MNRVPCKISLLHRKCFKFKTIIILKYNPGTFIEFIDKRKDKISTDSFPTASYIFYAVYFFETCLNGGQGH